MSPHLPLALSATGIVATLSCVYVWLVELQRQRRQEQHGADGDGARKSARPYERGMREREYVRLIPDCDMALLKSLLRRICKARGWNDDVASRDAAWERVLAAAQLPDGGAWPLDFHPGDVTPQQLQQLCDGVEAEFLGGLLSAQVRRSGRPRVKVVLGVDPNDPHSWLSGLHEDNTIFVNAERWREVISEANPMNFEGALCGSKLEALAHALAHELTHAVVLNFFPAMDSSSPAYLPDDKHGPIFMLLNRRLFGHVGHASQRLFNA